MFQFCSISFSLQEKTLCTLLNLICWKSDLIPSITLLKFNTGCMSDIIVNVFLCLNYLICEINLKYVFTKVVKDENQEELL